MRRLTPLTPISLIFHRKSRVFSEFAGNPGLNGPDAAVLCMAPIDQRAIVTSEAPEVGQGRMLEAEKSFHFGLNQSRRDAGDFVFEFDQGAFPRLSGRVRKKAGGQKFQQKIFGIETMERLDDVGVMILLDAKTARGQLRRYCPVFQIMEKGWQFLVYDPGECFALRNGISRQRHRPLLAAEKHDFILESFVDGRKHHQIFVIIIGGNNQAPENRKNDALPVFGVTFALVVSCEALDSHTECAARRDIFERALIIDLEHFGNKELSIERGLPAHELCTSPEKTDT
jgi:hypothetical protein